MNNQTQAILYSKKINYRETKQTKVSVYKINYNLLKIN